MKHVASFSENLIISLTHSKTVNKDIAGMVFKSNLINVKSVFYLQLSIYCNCCNPRMQEINIVGKMSYF